MPSRSKRHRIRRRASALNRCAARPWQDLACQRREPEHADPGAKLGSSCVSPRRSSNANSLCGQNSAGSRESVRPFKGIVCDDVSEFESYMPSHAVRLHQLTFERSRAGSHLDAEKSFSPPGGIVEVERTN